MENYFLKKNKGKNITFLNEYHDEITLSYDEFISKLKTDKYIHLPTIARKWMYNKFISLLRSYRHRGRS